jgi:hypothetical protein
LTYHNAQARAGLIQINDRQRPFVVGRHMMRFLLPAALAAFCAAAMRLLLPTVLSVAVFVAPPAHAATHDDEVRQFAYGRDLVAHCRSAVRDPLTAAQCETRAVWWNSAGCCVPSVPLTIQWGASYQMLAMMREAGLSLGIPSEVWGVIKTRFHRDPTEYCANFRVDCTPVLAELAATRSVLEQLDKIGEEMDREKRAGQSPALPKQLKPGN